MEPLISKLEAVIDKVLAGTTKLKFNTENAQQLYSVCLSGTILELACGCLALYKTDNHNCVPVVARSILEAYVDLANLIKDKKYIVFMNVAYLNEKSRILKSAVGRRSSNPYLEKLSNWESLDVHFEHIQSEINELKGKGFEKLGVRDRFERADLIQLYESVYASLCHHSHNNLNVLEKRHLTLRNSNISVEFFQPVETGEIIPIADTIAGLLVDSMRIIWSVLDIKDDSFIEETDRALNELRQLY